MDSSKKVIAVVAMIEDEAILREAYQIILDAEGFKTLTASSGQEGLKLITESKPDVVLLDMLMPDLNGLDFLRIFDAKKHPETKIIVFSNLSDPIEVQAAMDLGAWQYLVKADYTPTQIAKLLKGELKSNSLPTTPVAENH